MAEGVGFEPTHHVEWPNGLANRPLNHLSTPPYELQLFIISYQ